MEFWGVEVQPGKTVDVEPGEGRLLHLSLASLGEAKKDSGNENVLVYLKVDDQKLVLGNLNVEKCAQIQFDLVLEKEFQLSHTSKHASVCFLGYRNDVSDDDEFGDDFDDGFPLAVRQVASKPVEKVGAKPSEGNANTARTESMAAKAKVDQQKKTGKANAQAVKVEDEDDDDDEDDVSDDDDDDDDEMDQDDDSDEDDEEESDDEATPTPKKVDSSKKRPGPNATSTSQGKKPKLATPAKPQKSEGDKKGAHIHTDTPHPAKKPGKSSASPKSASGIVCKSCNKTFGGEMALQAHSKAKHGAAK